MRSIGLFSGRLSLGCDATLWRRSDAGEIAPTPGDMTHQ
jgi:hypothetical protein